MGFNVLAIPFSYNGFSDCFCHVGNLKCLFALSWFSERGCIPIFHVKVRSFFLKVLGAALAMGSLLWYNCPSIEEWAAMTF